MVAAMATMASTALPPMASTLRPASAAALCGAATAALAGALQILPAYEYSRLARRFEGVGLGLPLANAFARLHGAQLAIDSTPGKGTVVTIAFPPERTLPERQALRA